MKNILTAMILVSGLGLTGCASWCHHGGGGGECSMHSQKEGMCGKCGKKHADCPDCKKAGSGECPMDAKDASKEAAKEAPKK